MLSHGNTAGWMTGTTWAALALCAGGLWVCAGVASTAEKGRIEAEAPATRPETDPAASTPAAKQAEAARPRVEVVFVLDTTGSMGGLIAGAKEKIWSITNTLIEAEQSPEVLVGLVAYRDRGDAYITRRSDLTLDLDTTYSELMGYQAQGGGDTPESVNQGLHEAVTRITWSEGEKVYRVIFLVGDCPPHMDYRDDIQYQASCKLAREKGIVINTIQCGNHGATTPIWKEIAQLGGGRYMAVAQSGGAVTISAPQDAEIARLSRELDGTRLYYGSSADRARQERKRHKEKRIYARASESAAAQRASFNASAEGAANFAGHKELLSDLAAGRVTLAAVPEADLPKAMQAMSAAERAAHVTALQAKRARLQREIRVLADQRQAHIQAEVAKRKDKGAGALESQVFEAVREQAAEKGLEYDAADLRW